jgi:ABC-type lipoprotein release transport system permease subunit
VARSLAEEQVHTRLTESLFVFPPWLTVGVPLFVGALTMLAEFYPARRAARVNPVARLDRPRVQDDGPDNLPQR